MAINGIVKGYNVGVGVGVGVVFLRIILSVWQ